MIMTDEEYKRLEAQFNEGILLGVQAATGKMIELLQLNPSWTTPRGLTQATAEFKIAARYMLQKRGIVSTRYEVIQCILNLKKIEYGQDRTKN